MGMASYRWYAGRLANTCIALLKAITVCHDLLGVQSYRNPACVAAVLIRMVRLRGLERDVSSNVWPNSV